MAKNPMRSAEDYSTGRITFQIHNQPVDSQEHKYLNVSYDIESKRLELIKQNWWGEQQPRIIVVIASDHNYLNSWTSERELNSFKIGLMKAAKSTYMLIITNGTNTGASKIVGEAVNYNINKSKMLQPDKKEEEESSSYKLNVVGISERSRLNYDNIFNKDLVTLNVDPRLQPSDQVETRRYKLEPNLTHYVMVREKENPKFEINSFTKRFLEILAKPPTDNGKTSPIVFLVMQGRVGCAQLVKEHLKLKCPVIVLKGSGGFADLLAFVFEEMEQRYKDLGILWDKDFLEESLNTELRIKIVQKFPTIKDDEMRIEEFCDNIIECARLARQDDCIFISILVVNNPVSNFENLSEFLLRAIIKSQRAETEDGDNTEMHERDLKLSIEWNCPEVAKKIFTRYSKIILENRKFSRELFDFSLKQPNREEFVDLFITFNFKITEYLEPTKLTNLFKLLLAKNRDFFRVVCWEGILGHFIGSNISKDFVDNDLPILIEECTGLNDFINSETLYFYILKTYPVNEASADRKVLTLLTFWAVLANRRKLVKILWKNCDLPIHLALIIASMYQRLSQYVEEESLKEDLEKQSRIYGDIATQVLNDSYSISPTRAIAGLKLTISDWNYKTAAEIAADSGQMMFLANPCCQKYITLMYEGHIKIKEMKYGYFTIPISIKIFLSAILIFPMYIWVIFDYESKKPEPEKLDEEENYDELAKQIEIKDDTTLKIKEDSSETTVHENKYLRRVTNFYRDLIISNQPPIHRMIYLMWTSSITKFWTYHFFYILFLMLFSVAVIHPNCGNFYLDLLTCVCAFLIEVEYLRRTCLLNQKLSSSSLSHKLMKILCVISFILFYFYVRVIGSFVISPYNMKVVLCIALLYFYWGLFTSYMPIAPALGPFLYRLNIMVTVDFLNFVKLSSVVILSGGVTIQAMLFPDATLNADFFADMILRAVMALFRINHTEFGEDYYHQEMNEDDRVCQRRREAQAVNSRCLSSDEFTDDLTCPIHGIWTYFFSIQYFIILKLALIALLYALFSASGQRLSKEADNIWKFQRYMLVTDFAYRVSLPPPFNAIIYAYQLGKGLINWFKYVYKAEWRKPKTPYFAIQTKNDLERTKAQLTEEVLMFWKFLGSKHFDSMESKSSESETGKRELELAQNITEEMNYKKNNLHRIERKTKGLKRKLVYLQMELNSLPKESEHRDEEKKKSSK